MILKTWQAVFALLNAMVKGVILILPVLTFRSGWLESLLLIISIALFNFYSCYIYINHLGNDSDIDKAIYHHFWNSKTITILYNLTIFANILIMLTGYFLIISQQWDGLVSQSILNPILNGIFLFCLVMVLKYVRFGAHLLSYGLITIFIYCGFLIWILASEPAGSRKITPFGTDFANTAALIAEGISIQQFFIPVLKEMVASQSKNFAKISAAVYGIGIILYIFISVVGSLGIINRPQVLFPLKSIESFFQKGQWQVMVMEIIYVIHLYTLYGWFIIIGKKRFFCILHMLWRVKNSRSNQFFTIPEILFVLAIVSFNLGVCLLGISLQILIVINGGVVGFFFVYLFPVAMHFKCLYTPRPKSIFEVVYGKQNMGNQLTDWQSSSKGEKNSQVYTPMFKKQTIAGIQQYKKRGTTFAQNYKIQNLSESADQPFSQNGSDCHRGKVNLRESQQKPIESAEKKIKQVENIQTNSLILCQGADLSVDLQDGKRLSVNKIGFQCQAQIPKSKKNIILNVIGLVIMLAYGMYIMVMSILAITRHELLS